MGPRKIKIFISFASDVEKECNLLKKIIDEETKNHFSRDGYIFEPICWRDILPGLGNPQRDKIDPVIADPNCKLVVILLKNRLGTYRDGETGIEHEYNLAKSYQKEVWIYDCDFIIEQKRSEIELDQIKVVNDFIQKVRQEGLTRKIFNFEGLSYKFRHDFVRWAVQLMTNESDLSKMEVFSKHNRGF